MGVIVFVGMHNTYISAIQPVMKTPQKYGNFSDSEVSVGLVKTLFLNILI